LSIEDTDIVDFISVDPSGSEVELTISDHLDWENADRHIQLLQSKIFRYLDFIDSGEIHQSYPAAAGKQLVIRIRAKFPPGRFANEVFDFIKSVARENGVKLVSVADR
jgi:hypothetical protein